MNPIIQDFTTHPDFYELLRGVAYGWFGRVLDTEEQRTELLAALHEKLNGVEMNDVEEGRTIQILEVSPQGVLSYYPNQSYLPKPYEPVDEKHVRKMYPPLTMQQSGTHPVPPTRKKMFYAAVEPKAE